MGFKDILLTLNSYPEPTPVAVFDDALSLATELSAHIAAIACAVRVELPGSFLAGAIGDIPGLVASEAAKSRDNAKSLLAAFDAAADRAGISHEAILEKCVTHRLPALLVEYARLRDLTIMPVPEGKDQWSTTEVIFESGRPTLVLPTMPRPRPLRLDCVGVAWDFSRTAARAVSNALPLLEKAKRVRIVTVTNEKVLDTKHSADELAKNLARHGIEVVLDIVDAAGRPIGEVLDAYVASHKIDVLVMGAYGTPRWREFILGGATSSLLSKPPVPLLLSH
jgi:nucleotide-binding universal stress UspA family protein